VPVLEEQKVVLVVDDNQAIRENLGECLELEGYLCWLASNADEALRRLERESRAPDAVLLDLKMPGMPAAQFVRVLKQQMGWSRIPIILTTAALDSDVPKDLAFDALLPRPFDVSRLLELVHHATNGGAQKNPSEPR
jgi:CheY-like chemotaxis protein